MYDERGGESWAAETDTYGVLRDVRGPRQACPFRFPGQYEDAETGLYYNRFRYYDPEAGGYLSQDPIGLLGSANFHQYVNDPNLLFDPLGLAACAKAKRAGDAAKPHAFWSGEGAMEAAAAWARKNGGVTLEMTGRGKRAARLAENLEWILGRPVWAKQSKAFAKESTGEVRIFATKSALTRTDSILNEVELPALRRNPNVTKITIIPVP